jgi:hypothetical protein
VGRLEPPSFGVDCGAAVARLAARPGEAGATDGPSVDLAEDICQFTFALEWINAMLMSTVGSPLNASQLPALSPVLEPAKPSIAVAPTPICLRTVATSGIAALHVRERTAGQCGGTVLATRRP